MNKKLIILGSILVLGIFLISSCKIEGPVGKKIVIDKDGKKITCGRGNSDSLGCCVKYCDRYVTEGDEWRAYERCMGFCDGRYVS